MFYDEYLEFRHVSSASKFLKGYGDKDKGFGERKFHSLVATQGSTIVLLREEFLILKNLDHWKMHSWVCGLPPYISANMVDIRSFFCNFERTELHSFAVSLNQINLTNRLKTNVNLGCLQEISKPYLPSLPDLSTVNTANHNQQFHKHCKYQK